MQRIAVILTSVIFVAAAQTAGADTPKNLPTADGFFPLHQKASSVKTVAHGQASAPLPSVPEGFFPLKRAQAFMPLPPRPVSALSAEATPASWNNGSAKHADPYAMTDEQAQQILSIFSATD